MIEQYLERLYTWESLENTERGVEFELKNRLVDAEVHAVTEVKFDEEAVPPETVALEVADDELYPAEEITPENPLELGLAEAVQVVCDVERLRLGVHELEVGLRIEGYGEVDFTIDEEVTRSDILDVDPADYTVAELDDLAAAIAEPETFERLLERERAGKARKTAIETMEDGLEDAEPLTEEEMVRTEVSERESGAPGGLLGQLLTEVLETPQRVSVYLAVKAFGSGTPEEVAGRTVLPEGTVRSTLTDLEAEGIATRRDDGTYRVASPVTVLRKRQARFWSVFRNVV